MFSPRLVTYYGYKTDFTKRLQLIYVDMEIDSWLETSRTHKIHSPYNRKELNKRKTVEQLTASFIIDFFDISVVQNAFDGESFIAGNINHILQKKFTFNSLLTIKEVTSAKQLARKTKYQLRGFEFEG